MIALIGLAAFLTVSLFAVALGRTLSERRTRLRTRVEFIAQRDRPAAENLHSGRLLRMQNYSSVPWLQRFLQSTPRAERLADELDRAGIPLRVGEYLAMSAGAALALALLAYRLLPAGPLSVVGMVGAVLLGGWLLPRWYVKRFLRRRRARIDAQLPDALDIISRSIRTGNGLLIAMDAVVEQMPRPISDEFGRMRQEITAGIGVEDAFRELDRRVASQDLHIVVTAFLVQREVGGNLTEILDNVATTMRARTTLRREMRALTSQQRYGAFIVAAIPPGIVLFLTAVNHQFMAPLFASTLGWVALGIAGGLELAGILALQMVTSFEV